jgi:hypothetical protein
MNDRDEVTTAEIQRMCESYIAVSGFPTRLTSSPARSPELTRMMGNTGKLPPAEQAIFNQPAPAVQTMIQNHRAAAGLLTAAEKRAAYSPEVKRVLSVSRPSMLSAADQEALIPEATRRILANYESASGYRVLPTSKERP